MEDKKVLEILMSMQSDMKNMQGDMGDMKVDMIDIKESQLRIEKKLDAINNQTADLTEFRTEINMKLDKSLIIAADIKNDLTNVEIITSSNWNDIAKLKSVK